MRERVANGTEARAHRLNELLRSELGCRIHRPMIGPGVVVVQRAHLLRRHLLPHLQDWISFVIPSESEESALDRYFVVRFLPIAVAINRRLFLFYRHPRRMIGLSIGWKRSP